jgi:hypothetical protein
MHEHGTWDKSHRIVLLLLLVACILMAACWWHQIDAEKISYDVERCVLLMVGLPWFCVTIESGRFNLGMLILV